MLLGVPPLIPGLWSIPRIDKKNNRKSLAGHYEWDRGYSHHAHESHIYYQPIQPQYAKCRSDEFPACKLPGLSSP
ncbi:Thioredoxin-like protein 1 [Fusarium oxysporum f. sp. albedinis]|nr:Thioredoxin-like protein 1 [Fusarium oxysporum f. sp. albedinis]